MIGLVLLMLLVGAAVLLAVVLWVRSATILVGQIRRKEVLSLRHAHIAALLAAMVAMYVCYNHYCLASLSQAGLSKMLRNDLLTFALLVFFPYIGLLMYRFYQGLRPGTFSVPQEVRVLTDRKGARDAILVALGIIALLSVVFWGPHAPRTILIQAAKSHNTRVVAMLLALGADPNVRGRSSLTPLQFACRNNDLEMVRNLLANGADVNYPSSIGALEFASRHKDLKLFTRLLEHGANVNDRSSSGDTPLAAVVRKGCPMALRMLLERGVDVNARDLTKMTPLMKACAAGNTGAVKVLLEYGADVNAASSLGDTALICACWWKPQPEIVKALLEKGADVTARQWKGKTALMIAQDNRALEVQALLVQAASAAHMEDNSGNAPRSQSEERKPLDAGARSEEK